MAVVNPSSSQQLPRTYVLSIVAALIAVTALLWGPVARGLHEESVVRWCSAAQGVARAEITTELSLQIAACVEQALTDPAYMTALRASL